MFEFFIAKKYLKTKNELNFISIISIISTLGITIGVAALIIVISVFNGFGSFAKQMLIESQPHIRIVAISEKSDAATNKLEEILSGNNSIVFFTPYLQGKIVITNNNNYQMLDIKGLKKNNDNSQLWVEKKLLGGSLDLSEKSEFPGAVINLTNAMNLSVRIGDRITVTSLNSIEKMITNFLVIPNSQQFIITGISKSRNKAGNDFTLYTNLTAAEKLLGTNSISGYEIKLDNYKNAEKVKKELSKQIDSELFTIKTWYDMNSEFYNVLQLERWGAFILLLLIISVATFNILVSLTMSVLEKKRDIGILRSMGVTKKSILKIFMFKGILIGIIGTISGMLLGLLICYLQMEYKIYPLDSTKYIIDALPVELQISDLILVPATSMLLTFVASLYPARRAVKINVIDSIKYE